MTKTSKITIAAADRALAVYLDSIAYYTAVPIPLLPDLSAPGTAPYFDAV